MYLAFQNGLQYLHSDFKIFICDDLATLYVNLVNFGPVTPQFGYVSPLLELTGISTEFSEAITNSVLFQLFGRASLLCREGYTLGSATHF